MPHPSTATQNKVVILSGVTASQSEAVTESKDPYPTNTQEEASAILLRSGISLRESVARVAKLNVILDCARLEHFALATENRSLAEVALEMLSKRVGC